MSAILTLTVVGVAFFAIAGVAIYGAVTVSGKEPLEQPIGLETLAAVGELTLNNGSGTISCSTAFVGPSGQVLTAVHCFQQPTVCDFDPVVGEYPLSSAPILVDVSYVNGTGERWTFDGVVLGWSGITDLMLVQLTPKVKIDGATITLTTQRFLGWGSNRALSHGERARSLSFDLALLKKLGHGGAVLHPYADRGSSFAVSTEQVFIDLNAEDGASGSASINPARQVIMAPLSYGWSDEDGNIFAVSGTSSDVSGALVRRILSGTTPPNGPAHNKFLVPTLGIIPQYVLSGINVQTNLNSDYGTMFENKGVVFFWLAVQGYYDFLTQAIFNCGFPPYTLTPPSLLGAVLSETYYGNAPPFFEDFPAFNSDTIVVLLAIERGGQWVYLGEDAGLETISGVLATGGYWVGDTVRVRVKSGNPYNTTPDANWEAAYSVTLLPVDPFWDTVQSEPFINYASFIRVNRTQGQPTALHYDKSVGLAGRAKLLMAKRDLHGRKIKHRTTATQSITEPPPGADISGLPTLTDLYLEHAGQRRARAGSEKKK